MLAVHQNNKAINTVTAFTLGVSIVNDILFHLGLVCILLLLSTAKGNTSLTPQIKLAFWLTVQWIIIKLIRKTLVTWELNGAFLEDTLRWLVMSLTILWFARKNITFQFKPIAIGAAMALYLAGLVATYQHLVQGIDRAGGSENPINFGIFISIYSVIVLTFLIKYWYKTSLRIKLFSLLALPVGIIGMLLTGSRGAMLTFCVTGLSMSLYLFRSQLHKKRVLTSVLLSSCIVVSGISYFAWSSGIITASVYQYDVWKETRAMTRIGARLEFWISSIDTFLQYPIYGASDNLRTLQSQGGKYFQFNPLTSNWTHAHNEMLEALGKFGIIGFTSIWLIWLTPLILAKQKTRTINPDGIETLAFIYLTWFLAGLTQVLTHHTSGLTLLPLFAAIFLNLSPQKSYEKTG